MDEDICYIHNHVSSVFLAQVAAHTQDASKSQLHVVIRKMHVLLSKKRARNIIYT